LGSIVFIILYLPEIAFPEQHDQSKWFYVCYAGSLILLGFNLTMVMMPEWYGISDGSLPARISFIGWYLVDFCTNYFYHLPIIFFTRNRRKTISSKDSKELKVVLNNLKYLKGLKQFLIAFFYSIGVQTVILLGAFGKKNWVLILQINNYHFTDKCSSYFGAYFK
jgi:UMF1 family MFS transporter